MNHIIQKIKSLTLSGIKILPLWGVGGLFLLTSCLHNQGDIFSENSSARTTAYLDSAKHVLLSGNATWLMEMYPSSSQQYGGWVFTMRFSGDSVYCRTEMTDSTTEIASLWRTTRDDGPVLSFDTYNQFIHYMSTPSSSLYQAYQGEFEWVITDITTNLLTLRGKKTGNTIYMRRMQETPQSYLNKIAEMKEAMIITGLVGWIGDDSLTVAINTSTRQINFTDSITTYSSAYSYTPEGIRLYRPLAMGGSVITSLTADFDETGGVTGMTTNTGDKFKAVYPTGYCKYDEFIGDYALWFKPTYSSYSQNKVTVSLVEAEKGSTYYMKGLNPNYDLIVKYDRTAGTLQLCSQIALSALDHQPYVSSNGYYIGCMAWYAVPTGRGYVSYVNTVGMQGKWNSKITKQFKVDFSDNGVWQAGYTVNSFKLYYFNSLTPSDDSRMGEVTNTAEYIQSNAQTKTSTLPYVQGMIRQ